MSTKRKLELFCRVFPTTPPQNYSPHYGKLTLIGGGGGGGGIGYLATKLGGGGGAKIVKTFCPYLGYLIGCFRVHPVFALSESDPGKFICTYASKHCSECILVPCHGVALQDKPLKVLHRGSEDCGGGGGHCSFTTLRQPLHSTHIP